MSKVLKHYLKQHTVSKEWSNFLLALTLEYLEIIIEAEIYENYLTHI
ncbi:unnamed protein product [marine sediment metagenome]|uniref:Uncharacterized protein n=1 Tax=marine sediment metagenome TaxID=412755 RepID=X1HIA9_9ZZZZ